MFRRPMAPKTTHVPPEWKVKESWSKRHTKTSYPATWKYFTRSDETKLRHLFTKLCLQQRKVQPSGKIPKARLHELHRNAWWLSTDWLFSRYHYNYTTLKPNPMHVSLLSFMFRSIMHQGYDDVTIWNSERKHILWKCYSPCLSIPLL